MRKTASPAAKVPQLPGLAPRIVAGRVQAAQVTQQRRAMLDELRRRTQSVVVG
ncbi:MAG: hypothetical protein KBF65_12010 [Rubrivivax sp.]|jgi:hypothetical protein|nr:hypothetical protein [Betaproteobacteria bacterium]MBP6317407.1 hypothetical protein [Rubrivivax sp.]MBK7278635.1 hypothetical protein [Betaproteobacteria bacterium]MBK7459918.1 hypothetical protein [Betaproteobacteria bacterium]MBK7517583.1 hypothetical protein [Betaproteobacteria bacterium]